MSRLKRYITLCGVWRNYKKLFEGCRSVKAKVAVLKKELEDLGVEGQRNLTPLQVYLFFLMFVECNNIRCQYLSPLGQPSIEKCKKARMKREEAKELAELDVSNIITTQGTLLIY